MPKPIKNFTGKILLSFGYCSNNRQYTQKDLDEVDIFDYCKNNDIINDNNIEILHSLKGTYEKVDTVECIINDNILNINGELYTYIKDDDIFMNTNSNKYNEFVRIHAIYDTCYSCKNTNEIVIPYCFNENWICNNCILDKIEYLNFYFK